ncbi:MAG: hypothetical protein LBK25_05575 [Treponema sp.]|jgi:hypothetical protein|nr:hypothetical protein [Treponema sp.]
MGLLDLLFKTLSDNDKENRKIKKMDRQDAKWRKESKKKWDEIQKDMMKGKKKGGKR